MSEAIDSNGTERQTPTLISNRRILWTMAAVVVLGGLASLIFVSALFGLGFFIGGVLAFVNYFWLKSTLKKVFVETTDGGREYRPHYSAARYLSRYLTLGAILLIVFLTETVSVVAVVFGLSSFAFAVMVEGFIRIFSSFFNKKEI